MPQSNPFPVAPSLPVHHASGIILQELRLLQAEVKTLRMEKGVHRRRRGGLAVRHPKATPAPDLVRT